MQINGNFIKEQFKKIQEKYKLEITLEDEYRIEYQNKKIRIYFGTERWDDGVIISVTNKLNNKFYDIFDIETGKGFDNFEESLSSTDKSTMKNLKEGNDQIVFAFRILLEKHCQDVLSGDFSSIGTGRSH